MAQTRVMSETQTDDGAAVLPLRSVSAFSPGRDTLSPTLLGHRGDLASSFPGASYSGNFSLDGPRTLAAEASCLVRP